jgi:UDP-2,3-diacylglucosamine hydrolase
MVKRFAVVLSDVHIGNNTPTCWYQASIHEPQLTEVLKWILARREVVREVILLGDLFDVWTYPPSVKPPTMGEIIAANRTLLGSGGPFAALVRALPGRVRLLLGNHDGSLTARDVALLNQSLGGNQARGERIELVTDPWRVVTGTSGARTVFSHGHHWCMFNAPDTRSRWSTIPIGHIVSRALAYRLTVGPHRLGPKETAAHRHNSGNPSPNFRQALGTWRPGKDLGRILIEYFCKETGMSQTERVVMPGPPPTTAQEAVRIFANLYELWTRREGRGRDAYRAAAAELSPGDDLAWFAQRLAMRTASDLAVMGHTHTPVAGVAVSPVNYVNSGFMCVPKPDAPRTQFTFTQVDLEKATAQVLALVPAGGGYAVTPAKAPVMDSVILRGLDDYSCYVRVENRSDRPLRRVSFDKDATSYWVVAPPPQIAPRSRADIWLIDPPLPRGSGGSFTYTDGKQTLKFAFACPRTSDNSVSSPVADYQTKVGRGAWRTGGVDPKGFPLQVRFFVGTRRVTGVGPGPRRPGLPGAGPAIQRRRPGATPPRPFRRPRREQSPFVVAASRVLDAHGSPSNRGAVMCVAHLTSNDGQPLLIPDKVPSDTRPGREKLRFPPKHIPGPDIETVTVGTTKYEFVWIHPNVPPDAPPNVGGMAFLPRPGSATFTVLTFNVAALLDRRRGCRNDHHAEMQLTRFIREQDARFQLRLGKLELHNYSRRGVDWGWSACNKCLEGLAIFLKALNNPGRTTAPARASIGWERLYEKGAPGCGHETDGAHIKLLMDAGWDHPQGPMPEGARELPPARPPAAPPARPPAPATPPDVYTA